MEWIARIRARAATADPARVAIGIGDDAAVLGPRAAGAVLSVDACVEDVHFVRGWLAPADIGWRAWVAALSDLAAMGARPVAGLLSLVARDDEDEAMIEGLFDGVAEAAQAYDAPLIGGNLSSGPTLMLSSTVIGDAPATPWRRDAAVIGDAVYVTGPVGEAALGWRILRDGGARTDDEARAVARWRRPRARFDRVDALTPFVHAAIDVSDGLAQDLGHLCAASGVGARIELSRVPLALGFEAVARARGEDPRALALGGGEDYELLFTAPPGSVDPAHATDIGRVTEARALRFVDPDGREHEPPRGHRHFHG